MKRRLREWWWRLCDEAADWTDYEVRDGHDGPENLIGGY